ncbi:MAG: NADH-quinone oxidoreductase subunit C [Verrucomicrobiia bacterium]
MNQETKNVTAPPAIDENLEKLRTQIQTLLGDEAVFELNGKLPAFRIPAKSIHSACKKLKENGFDFLLFVTAVDYPQENKIEMVYMIGNYSDQRQLALVADIDRANPEIETVCDIWAGANWHEREVYDLFGVKFINHPFLRRILLDDTWEGHPLRKDYVDKVHNVVKRPY